MQAAPLWQSTSPIANDAQKHAEQWIANRIPVELEVPVTWFPVPHDGERHRWMFAWLCSVLANKPVAVKMSQVTGGMHHIPRTAPEGGLVLSYHSCGDGDNIWRIKETPIAGWYSFDENGFSGWSSLARFPEKHASQIEAMAPQASLDYVNRLRIALRQQNKSKYTQSTEAFSVDQPYVYFPLQKIDDPVAQFCRIDTMQVLYRAAELADSTGIPLVVKRHPLCDSKAVADTLAHIGRRFRNVIISQASIHQHLEGCRSVIVANSGVGMEALMYFKPVFTFAASEYELATRPMSDMDEIAQAFAPSLQDVTLRCARFLHYYLENCCFCILDPNTISRCIDRALEGAGPRTGAPAITNRTKETAQAYTEIENLKRVISTCRTENIYLKRMVQQAADLVKKLESTRHEGAEPQLATADGNSEQLAAARQTAQTLYEGAFSASTSEVKLTLTLSAAYRSYAQLALSAQGAPNLRSFIQTELLKSAYASGTDPNIAHRNTTATDYQKLHDTARGYQDNNWLVEHCDVIRSALPETIIEVGCGNGKFLKAIAPAVNHAIGLDWARSSQLHDLPANVEFIETNVLQDTLPSGDVCCSADVLEHFEPSMLPGLLKKLHGAARFNYHVIACYDDGHSHCAVLHPGQWLGLFQSISPGYRLAATMTRPSRPDRLVCVITNIPDAESHFPKLGPLVDTWKTESGERISFCNDFTIQIGGKAMASWFPMANGSASIKWHHSNMLDTAALDKDGQILSVSTIQGESFNVSRQGSAT